MRGAFPPLLMQKTDKDKSLRVPKDNTDPMREVKHTLPSGEADLAECVLKNSSLYPQGLDFQ